jgi:hypothetical protein
MATLVPGRDLRKIQFGNKVDRATAALPQTATGTLFTVSGGRILLTGIVGEVTTVIQTQANNTKLVHTPTTGSAVDLCAVLNISAKEVGTLFGITGLFSDALVGANACAGVMPRNPVVLPIGNLGLSCAASNTGSVKWSITWVPLDDAGVVVAA